MTTDHLARLRALCPSRAPRSSPTSPRWTASSSRTRRGRGDRLRGASRPRTRLTPRGPRCRTATRSAPEEKGDDTIGKMARSTT